MRTIVQIVMRTALKASSPASCSRCARAGETAPLLFTALGNHIGRTADRTHRRHAAANIYLRIGPYDDQHRQAWRERCAAPAGFVRQRRRPLLTRDRFQRNA